jgi:hypothetical protein
MNLFFWRESAGAWLNELGRKYGKYQRPPHAYGMTTDNELQFLETYAREQFRGEGTIFDLGCWYGATTMSLARGLASNDRARAHRTIKAIDLFEWQEWMNPLAQESISKHYANGESFYEDVKALLRPYGDLVQVEKVDLMHYIPPASPVEFLFVDAMKNWELAQKIVSGFFPMLISGTSYVVQQDFAYYFSEMATNHLIMWYLRDHFRCEHHVPRSCSVVFRCVKQPKASALPQFVPGLFTLQMIEEAYEYSLACVSDDMRVMVDVAKLNFLIEQGDGHQDAIRRQMKRLAHYSTRLDEPMLPEVRRVAAKSGATHRLSSDGLAEINDWAASHGRN